MPMTFRQPNMNDKNGTSRRSILQRLAARDNVRPARKPNSTASDDAVVDRRAVRTTKESGY